jgi:hypothetical protein
MGPGAPIGTARIRLASSPRPTVANRLRRDLESRARAAECHRCADESGKRGHGRRRVGFYGCLAYQKRGTTVCANNLVVRMDRIDEAVLTPIGGDVLKPKIITAVIAGVRAAMKRQRRRDELIAALESVAPTGAQRDIEAIEIEARCKLEEWRALLTRQTQDGRELLRQILVGPIRFMPDGKMYRFHGKAALGKLLAGAASNLCGVPGRS